MERKLLMTKRSPYARKVRIILREKGLPYEEVLVDLSRKPTNLLQTGPLQKVPVLLDGPLTIVDSSVICEYLEDRYPAMTFLPVGYLARADARMWDQLADDVADAAIRVWSERGPVGGPHDWSAVEKAERFIQRSLDYAEDVLRSRELLVASRFTLADAAFVSTLGYIEFRLGAAWRARHPYTERYFNRLHERPSVQETVPVAG